MYKKKKEESMKINEKEKINDNSNNVNKETLFQKFSSKDPYQNNNNNNMMMNNNNNNNNNLVGGVKDKQVPKSAFVIRTKGF